MEKAVKQSASPLEKPRTNYHMVILSLVLNFAMSPLLILLNKTVYTTYGFPNITLTFIHFVCTTIGISACRGLGKYIHGL